MRPAGKTCDCEGCTTRRIDEAQLDRQQGTHMDKEIEVRRGEYHPSSSYPPEDRRVGEAATAQSL